VKLGVSNLGCPDWDLEKAAARAKEYGYAGIEMRMLDGEIIEPESVTANLERIRRVLRENGLELAALDTGAIFPQADPVEREAQEATVLEFLQLAKKLNAPGIRVFPGFVKGDMTREQAVLEIADSLNRLSPTAEEVGVNILLETHFDFCSVETLAPVFERVASPSVGLLWDIVHTYRVGDTTDRVFELLGSRILHCHVKDARINEAGKRELVLLGEGDVPIREMLQGLDARGFQGWLVFEWEKKWMPQIAEPEVAFPHYIRLMKEYLSEIQ
jgi:sugar phosphate isomerase/epimerase